MSKDKFWFTHDYNARNDDKILELRSEFGAEGYGVFWMIVETMADNENGGVKATLIGGLSHSYGVAKDRLLAIIDFCVKIELFYNQDGFFFSRRMLSHKKERKLFADAGLKGAESRWKKKSKNSPPIASPMPRIGHNNTIQDSSNSTSLIKIKTIIKGLGDFEISILEPPEKWQQTELTNFLTQSQREFEVLAMTKIEMNNTDNFKILLQDFVNRIQSSGKYQATPQLKDYFTNWINNKNGTLNVYIENLKAKSENKKSKMVF